MASIKSPSQLTAKDARILTALFDPEAASDTQAKEIGSSPVGNQQQDCSPYPGIPSHDLPDILAAERKALLPLKESAIPTLDAIRATLDSLTHLIAQSPLYSSAYVNRAQAWRMLWQHEPGAFSDPENTNLEDENHMTGPDPFDSFIKGVLDDLDEAIRLTSLSTNDLNSDMVDSTPAPRTPTTQTISQQQAQILRVAKSHRGFTLLQLASQASTRPPQNESPQTRKSRHPFQNLSKAQLEELASNDFAVAGRYGDKTAKEAAVALNPYARMCGAIVKNAMKEELDFALAVP